MKLSGSLDGVGSQILAWFRRFFGMPRWVVWLGSRAWFGMLTTLAIVFAGVCASLFTNSIRNTATDLIPKESDALGGWIFWLAVFTAGLLFWVNHAALTRKSDKARMDLETAVKRLNTIPSEIFLPTYSRCWNQAAGVTFTCIAASKSSVLKRSDVESAIQTVQYAILETAKDFDGASEAADYSANIMLWRNSGEKPESENALSVVRVAPEDPSIAGVLELIPRLSVIVKGQRNLGSIATGATDTLTKPILLPVPEDQEKFLDDKGREKLVLIPGAPLAFKTGSCAVFPTMQEFIALLRDGTTLDDRVKRRITHYFTDGEGKHIRSFASFAILSGRSAAELPIGVLNLHSNCAGILEDNGETLFAPVLAPFLSLLAVLLALRSQASVEAAEPAKPAPSTPASGGAAL